MAERDSLISKYAVKRTADRMPAATLVRMPAGHFDVYDGDGFESVVRIETEFLQRHLSCAANDDVAAA